METRGEILEAHIGTPPVLYHLLLWTDNGVSNAMFTEYDDKKRAWVGTKIPFVLSTNRELLYQFADALKHNGFILKTLDHDPVIRS